MTSAFEKRKDFTLKSAGEETGGKAQICPQSRVFELHLKEEMGEICIFQHNCIISTL